MASTKVLWIKTEYTAFCGQYAIRLSGIYTIMSMAGIVRIMDMEVQATMYLNTTTRPRYGG